VTARHTAEAPLGLGLRGVPGAGGRSLGAVGGGARFGRFGLVLWARGPARCGAWWPPPAPLGPWCRLPLPPLPSHPTLPWASLQWGSDVQRAGPQGGSPSPSVAGQPQPHARQGLPAAKSRLTRSLQYATKRVEYCLERSKTSSKKQDRQESRTVHHRVASRLHD